MQSDGNSLKIDTFREAITSELMISSLLLKNLFVRIRVKQKLLFVQNLTKRLIHKLLSVVVKLVNFIGFGIVEPIYVYSIFATNH